MIDWITVGTVVLFSSLSLIIGLMFGFMWGETNNEKYYKSIEQARKQKQMWEDYLNALKGANHEREQA